MIEYKLWR